MSRGRAGEKVGCAYALTWLLTFRTPSVAFRSTNLGQGVGTVPTALKCRTARTGKQARDRASLRQPLPG